MQAEARQPRADEFHHRTPRARRARDNDTQKTTRMRQEERRKKEKRARRKEMKMKRPIKQTRKMKNVGARIANLLRKDLYLSPFLGMHLFLFALLLPKADFALTVASQTAHAALLLAPNRLCQTD